LKASKVANLPPNRLLPLGGAETHLKIMPLLKLPREPFQAEDSDLFETFREASKYLGLILGHFKIGKKC